jgi:hypothetical protein
MTNHTSSQRASNRFLGPACAIGAAAMIVLSAASQVVQAGTTVPTSQLSYPLSSSGAARFFILAAAAQLLLAGGVLALRQRGVAGTTRAASGGLLAALVGTLLIVAGELGTVLLRHDPTDGGWPRVVEAVFAVATLLSTIGFLVAGVATLRAAVWDDWRRFTPLAIGIWSIALIALQFTGVAASAIGVYSACFFALGVAITRSEPRLVAARLGDARHV